LISASLLVCQVAQTRILSALFVYHYVFLVTSLALLGLGLGGLLVMVWPRLVDRFERAPATCLSELGLALGGAYGATFGLISAAPFLGHPLVYGALGMLPYLVGGAILALLFRSAGARIGRFYLADLMGAAAGCVAVIGALDAFGMLRTLILLPLLALGATLVMGPDRRTRSWAALGALVLLGSLLFGSARISRWEMHYPPYLTAPGKLLFELDRERGSQALAVVRTRWNSFSRTDVLEFRDEPDRKALTLDGVAYSGVFRLTDGLAAARSYPDSSGYLPSIGSLPYAFGTNRRVLVIGSGGGRDVIQALLAGTEQVDAVEVNAASVQAVRGYGDYAGHLYDRPDVNVVVANGRTFVHDTPARYDVIVLALVKTEAAGVGALSLVEDYAFTEEAFSDYYDHLTEPGRVAIFVHHEAALAKVTATAISLLQARGVAAPEIPNYLSVINSKNLDPPREVYQPLLLLKKSPFTEAEAVALTNAAERSENPIGYMPGLYETGRLGEVRRQQRKPADFATALPYQASPARDDAPFFYRFDRAIPGEVWLTLLGVLSLSLLALGPLIVRRGCGKAAAYFGCLGVAFMLIEIPLVGRCVLWLGNPTVAFSLVVFALLSGGSVGSYLTGQPRWEWRPGQRLWSALLVAALALVVSVAAHRFDFMLEHGRWWRLLGGCLTLFPLGLFMGMPFPLGLAQAARAKHAAEVPLYVAVNGAATVAGAVLAAGLSLELGFSVVIAFGALLYLALFVAFRG
jgi:hypothetical protein